MSRSIKKGPYVHPKLAKKVENAVRSNSREVIRTWSRASVIMPDMLGLTVAVHDVVDMYLCLSQKIWLAISWENLLLLGHSVATLPGLNVFPVSI